MYFDKQIYKDSSMKLLFRLIITLIFCISGNHSLHADKPSVEELTWWVAADSHVGHSSEPSTGEHLARSIADVNELGIADYAVMLGDLLEDDYAFSTPFIRTMNQLETNWTYVLGNHDFIRDANEPVLPVHYSGKTVKGIRFIFLSDEVTGAQDRDLVMSEEQEEWFWEELETHSDKPVFIFTHQPHPEFQKWPRLKEALDEYNIETWISGHKHDWNIEKNTNYGFAMINIHSIGGVRDDYLSTFLSLDRTDHTVTVTVNFRNHETEE